MGVRRVAIAIDGTVQGVGFRPFVAQLTRRLQLTGDVTNVGGRVHVDAQGAPEAIEELLRRLTTDAPAAARVTAVHARDQAPRASAGFHVRPSAEAAGRWRESAGFRERFERLEELIDRFEPQTLDVVLRVG